MNIVPTDFIFQHEYNLKNLNQDYKLIVKKAKTISLVESYLHPDYHHAFNLLFPGFTYSDRLFFKTYIDTIYDPLIKKTTTPSRGYVGKDSILIIGIAPGDSEYSFGEPVMLFGPSSLRLHEMLSTGSHYYFTNVSKNAFKKNDLDKEQIEQQLPIIKKELLLFDGCKIIFLGKYEVYDYLIEKMLLTRVFKAKHPAYFIYKGNNGLIEERDRITEFVKS